MYTTFLQKIISILFKIKNNPWILIYWLIMSQWFFFYKLYWQVLLLNWYFNFFFFMMDRMVSSSPCWPGLRWIGWRFDWRSKLNLRLSRGGSIEGWRVNRRFSKSRSREASQRRGRGRQKFFFCFDWTNIKSMFHPLRFFFFPHVKHLAM
jgi:hypothetical protein